MFAIGSVKEDFLGFGTLVPPLLNCVLMSCQHPLKCIPPLVRASAVMVPCAETVVDTGTHPGSGGGSEGMSTGCRDKREVDRHHTHTTLYGNDMRTQFHGR